MGEDPGERGPTTRRRVDTPVGWSDSATGSKAMMEGSEADSSGAAPPSSSESASRGTEEEAEGEERREEGEASPPPGPFGGASVTTPLTFCLSSAGMAPTMSYTSSMEASWCGRAPGVSPVSAVMNSTHRRTQPSKADRATWMLLP